MTVSKRSKFEKRKTFKKIILTFVSTILWIVGILMLIMCVSNIYQRWFNPEGYTGFFGIGEAVVSSNSMEPKINKGDLVFYDKPDLDDLQLGDTVIYKKQSNEGQILVIHDIVQLKGDSVVTKGWNNTVPDEAFEKKLIIGEYLFRIPQMGRLINLLSAPLAPVIIMVFLFIVAFIRIQVYCVKKKRTIAKITTDQLTRDALDYFFDI